MRYEFLILENLNERREFESRLLRCRSKARAPQVSDEGETKNWLMLFLLNVILLRDIQAFTSVNQNTL